ncbi:MAG: DUF445 domain-containing protein [Sporolactobacillus sp.]
MSKSKVSFADWLLCAAATLFVSSVAIKACFPDSLWASWLCFTTEASLVGGVADWFAVTALFTRPLGFPWHTAIITIHREKFIAALVNLVERHLLSASSISRKISRQSLIVPLIAFIDQSELPAYWIADMLANGARFLNEQPGARVEKQIKECLAAVELAPHISHILRWAARKPASQQLIDDALERAIAAVQEPSFQAFVCRELQQEIGRRTERGTRRSALWHRFAYQAAQSIDVINIDEVAQAVQSAVADTLGRLRLPQHPLRQELIQTIIRLADGVQKDDALCRMIEDWKGRALAHLSVAQELEHLMRWFADQLMKKEAPLEGMLSQKGAELWQWLKHSPAAQAETDRLMKHALLRLLLVEKQTIGGFVRQALDELSSAQLSQFINEKVGDNLQWIRVNGSLVGALIGAALFAFIHFVFPFIPFL